jgi:hypothetical protein
MEAPTEVSLRQSRRRPGPGHQESFATGGFQATNIVATMLERSVI